uniref:Uncharacterized protein n=1 Tax=Cacopsylla melanoneura TaxID=428564 RepID=A0A8D8S725_9HEMI
MIFIKGHLPQFQIPSAQFKRLKAKRNWNWGRCPSIKIMSEFKHDWFAGKTWYEYKRSGVPEWEKGTTCNKLYYNGPFSPKQSKMIFSKPDGFTGLAELFNKEHKKTAGRN